MYKVDNAIIMAAGTSSRFAPLSYEKPKSLIEVKGEVLIERQIKQLKAAGIEEIIIVVGYKKECFEYLKDKYGVILVENNDYLTRNNNASIYVVKDYLKNSYICSSDNYFINNPFEKYVNESYYSAQYSNEYLDEWFLSEDENGHISDVKIGGQNGWYMIGHTFWDEHFSRRFVEILEEIYNEPETENLLWESIFIKHINEFKMRIRKYDNLIYEFDSLNDLREFDSTYIANTRSKIIEDICKELNCDQSQIINLKAFKNNLNDATGFTFELEGRMYKYNYGNNKLT